ncbi:ScbR family autoregulator-binding transcription factor [Streptomyces sp. NPDC059063]|uniref:ScbR family autoregulator-binding transcription factor n=1 Tax=unclassified Streptomyces TaxID=2593676 RepID=UPI0036A6C2DD
MAQQERAVRTRQAILAAAAEVFDELGYEAATISEVLKRAGLTKGALYFHFASKEELAQGVLLEQVRALPPAPEHELVLQQSLDESLLLAHLLRPDTGHPIVRGAVRLTVDQGSPRDGLDRKTPMGAWERHVVAVLEKAKERGELLPGADLPAIGKLFVGAFTGVQVLSHIMTGRDDLPERVCDLYRYVLPAISVPGVLVRMDFDPRRGEQALKKALRLQQERALEVAASA